MDRELNFNPVTEDIRNIDSANPPGVRTAAFISEGEKLMATIFLANGAGPHPTVILLHGFPGNENNVDLAQSLRRAGYNVVFFHYRGLWGSSGDFSFSNSIEDTINVIKQIKALPTDNEYRINGSQITLIGHSMGGFCAVTASRVFPEIKKIGLLAAFNFGYFSRLMIGNEEYQKYTKDSLTGSEKYLGTCKADDLYNEMVNNIDEFDLTKDAERLSELKILLVGAELDETAPIPFHHAPLSEAIRAYSPVNFTETIIKTGHSFSNCRIKLQQTVIDWILEK